MIQTTHKTAVVLIPPAEVWEPIQRIRRRCDRQIRRWMPHVTLLSPFRPPEEFDALAGPLAEACRGIAPFAVTLGEFRWFAHGGRTFTLWLAPEPAAAVVALQAAVQAVTPDCDDAARFAHGFTPHLSVGQAGGSRRRDEILAEVRAWWQPLHFAADALSLIRRGDPPDDIFRVERTIPLGCDSSCHGAQDVL